LPIVSNGQSNKSLFLPTIPRDSVCFHLVNFKLNYQLISPNNISSSGNGISGSFGINFARYFTQKGIVGLYVQMKNRELLFPSDFDSGLNSYFNSNADISGLSTEDAIIAQHFIDETGSYRSLGGSARRQIGMMFFLHKRFLPVLQIYKGRTIELFDISDDVREITGNPDWVYLSYKTLGLEMTFFPLSKFKYNYQGVNLFLSLFVERSVYNQAKVNHISVSDFAPSFSNDYNQNIRFGLKIGIGML